MAVRVAAPQPSIHRHRANTQNTARSTHHSWCPSLSSEPLIYFLGAGRSSLGSLLHPERVSIYLTDPAPSQPPGDLRALGSPGWLHTQCGTGHPGGDLDIAQSSSRCQAKRADPDLLILTLTWGFQSSSIAASRAAAVSHTTLWEKSIWMELHSLPCFRAAPGMLHLPPASTSAYPARDSPNQTELSAPQPASGGERCCLPASQQVSEEGALASPGQSQNAPGENDVGR